MDTEGKLRRRRIIIRTMWFVFWVVICFFLMGMCTRDLELKAGNCYSQESPLPFFLSPGFIVVIVFYIIWLMWNKDTGGFTYKKDK